MSSGPGDIELASYSASMASLHRLVPHSTAGEESVSPLVPGASEIKVVLEDGVLLMASQGGLL